MSKQNDNQIQNLLKKTLLPVDCELRRDLWPQMLERLNQQSAKVPWFDWVLLATLLLWLFLFPGAIPFLLYHL